MKNKIILVLLMLSMVSPLLAQNLTVLDAVYVKENTQTRDPLPYTFLRESDVMWSKRIWRIIDLKEKINLPLAYPLTDYTNNRKSLIDVLMNAVKEGSLTAYTFENDEFSAPVTMKELEKRGGARVDTTSMTKPDPPYETYDTVIAVDFKRDDVIAYKLKEEWFFDKQKSIMDVRIIGVAPLIYAKNQDGSVREGNFKMALCWFYYPEMRKLLAGAEVFNRENDAQRRTFDDIFQKRLFSSFITKESNVYDRKIEDYKTTSIGALLEAERIKNDMVNFEHDMWEY